MTRNSIALGIRSVVQTEWLNGFVKKWIGCWNQIHWYYCSLGVFVEETLSPLHIGKTFMTNLGLAGEIRHIDLSLPGQNGRHFPDDIFKCIFMTEKFRIMIRISLKFVPMGSIDNKSALIQVMAWRHQATSHYLSQWWPSSYMQHQGEMI